MKNNIVIVLLLLLLTSACAQMSEKSETSYSGDTLPGTDQTNTSKLSTIPANDIYSDGKTQLIKTASYRFEVDNVKKSTEAIMVALRKYPAYISSSSLHLENPILENKMAIRVQSQYFHELLQEIDLQAKFVNHRDVTTADVSKEFVDLESRLKTKREVETRYMEILRKKAGTIEELMNAENQIGDLHEEIEATISRINYLKEQVSYSTINLEFYQTITQNLHASNEPAAGEKFLDALASGWKGVVTIALALTYVWPLIIGGIGVLLFVRLKMHPKAKAR